MDRKPKGSTSRLFGTALEYGRADTKRRRVFVAVAVALAIIVACWIGYRAWRAADRLQAYQRVLKPLPKDDPVYEDDPLTIGAVQNRPDYLTVKAGERLVSHWLPDGPEWPGGIVLLYLTEDTSEGKGRILSVLADITINGEERVISLYARRTDAPSVGNSWSGRVPSTEVGRLDRWLVLSPNDTCTIFAADRGLQEHQFVMPYILNGKALRAIGRYKDGQVTFTAAENESGPPQEAGPHSKSGTGRE